MKKLTKRNRTHNRKAIFGYHVECHDGEKTHRDSFKEADGDWTCVFKTDSCCRF